MVGLTKLNLLRSILFRFLQTGQNTGKQVNMNAIQTIWQAY